MVPRITLASIVVHRDGKRVVPEIGKPFDYTKEEIASILEGHPAALRKPINETAALRKPINETADEGVKAPAKTGDKAAAVAADKAKEGDGKPSKDTDDEL